MDSLRSIPFISPWSSLCSRYTHHPLADYMIIGAYHPRPCSENLFNLLLDLQAPTSTSSQVRRESLWQCTHSFIPRLRFVGARSPRLRRDVFAVARQPGSLSTTYLWIRTSATWNISAHVRPFHSISFGVCLVTLNLFTALNCTATSLMLPS